MRRPIGVFDSGVGGISVLRVLRRLLPGEDFYYIGDCKNAPYGEKTPEEIDCLAHELIRPLLDAGCKALVVACNTITAVSVAKLREELDIPVIGMEPALKPAQEMRRNGQIIVLATQATLNLEKFRKLYEKYGEETVTVAGTGLADLVERGMEDSGEAEETLHALLDGPLEKKTDAIVLGCTHYPFMKKAIQRVAPGVSLIDGNLGTARQVKRILEKEGCLNAGGEGTIRLEATGDEDGRHTALMRKLLSLPEET